MHGRKVCTCTTITAAVAAAWPEVHTLAVEALASDQLCTPVLVVKANLDCFRVMYS